jgi:hypothetical protein
VLARAFSACLNAPVEETRFGVFRIQKMFSDDDVQKYKFHALLAWIDDSMLQADRVRTHLSLFDKQDEVSRWRLRCSIYHWLVSTNKVGMFIQDKCHNALIAKLVGIAVLNSLADLKRVRAIWEHDIDHLSGTGHYQTKFMAPLDMSSVGLDADQLIAATHLIIERNSLKIGGIIDFEKIDAEITTLDRRLNQELGNAGA